jgi:hypothetical protein
MAGEQLPVTVDGLRLDRAQIAFSPAQGNAPGEIGARLDRPAVEAGKAGQHPGRERRKVDPERVACRRVPAEDLGIGLDEPAMIVEQGEARTTVEGRILSLHYLLLKPAVLQKRGR